MIPEYKVVLVGPKSYKVHEEPDSLTRKFAKDLRDNGHRLRSFDFSDYRTRGILLVPIEYKKTTERIRTLSTMYRSLVFCLYGARAGQYAPLVTEGHATEKDHSLYINCAPYEYVDWST